MLEPVEFVDESLELLVRRIESGAEQREPADLADVAEVVRKARARVDDVVHGQAPAPYRALELIEGAARWTVEEGYAAEEKALAELLPGHEAQASIYAYDVVERRIKRPAAIPDAQPRRIQRVGLVGAGLMAAQLATLFLRRLETPVVLTDVDAERAEQAVESIRGELAGLVAKGRLGEGKARFLGSIVTAGDGMDAYAGCDLVLEAVFEELAVKREVFAALEQVVSPECLLVTNTSSLSVAAMAEGLAHPERVVGLHFFNPVAVLPLVEVVRTSATDDVTLATAWDVTRKLGKRGVLVRDAPAFVVNRMLTRQSTVLMKAVESGNTFEETDEAALRLGIPMPPSTLLALVGPRVANHVLQTLNDAFPDRFPLSPTLRALADGELPVARGEARTRVRRRDSRGDPRGARRRGAPHPRRGRRVERRRARRVPDPRRGLPVLPRRDHQAPRPDGRLAARRGKAARRDREQLRFPRPPGSGSLRGAATPARRVNARASCLPRTVAQEGPERLCIAFEAAAPMQESTITSTPRPSASAWRTPRPRRALVRRAVPPPGRGGRRRARAGDRPTPRARRRPRRDGRGPREPVAGVEGALRADARARAGARRRDAADRRRHRAAPPPDRRARRHAHRADRGDAAKRRRERQRDANGAVVELVEEAEDEDDEDLGLVDEELEEAEFAGEDPGAAAATASAIPPRRARRSPPPASSRRTRTSAS